MRGLLSVTVVPTNGHNVPQALLEMMNQRGLVYVGGYCTDKVVDWLFAMGYPISEPLAPEASPSWQLLGKARRWA